MQKYHYPRLINAVLIIISLQSRIRQRSCNMVWLELKKKRFPYSCYINVTLKHQALQYLVKNCVWQKIYKAVCQSKRLFAAQPLNLFKIKLSLNCRWTQNKLLIPLRFSHMVSSWVGDYWPKYTAMWTRLVNDSLWLWISFLPPFGFTFSDLHLFKLLLNSNMQVIVCGYIFLIHPLLYRCRL